MSQAVIDARKAIFVEQHVIPTANSLGYVFDKINGLLTFYQINQLGIGAAQEISETDVDGFYFSAVELHQFHGMLSELVNMATGAVVNGGVAFRYRATLDVITRAGYEGTAPETGDPVQRMKYQHVEQMIALSDTLEALITQARCTLDFSISNGYGVENGRAGFQIDDTFLSTRYRFTAAQYNAWIALVAQADNFFTGDDPVTAGNFVVVNTLIKDPDA